jgi:hypothetical protein
MIHIRQIKSSTIPGEVYSVVVTKDWNKPLEEHPSIVEHPELFEIADCDIPNHSEYMIYESY